jgi:hypothetical protein
MDWEVVARQFSSKDTHFFHEASKTSPSTVARKTSASKIDLLLSRPRVPFLRILGRKAGNLAPDVLRESSPVRHWPRRRTTGLFSVVHRRRPNHLDREFRSSTPRLSQAWLRARPRVGARPPVTGARLPTDLGAGSSATRSVRAVARVRHDACKAVPRLRAETAPPWFRACVENRRNAAWLSISRTNASSVPGCTQTATCG